MIPLLDVCLLAALFEPAEQGDTCVGECRFNLKLCDLNLGINTNLMWGVSRLHSRRSAGIWLLAI